MYLYTVCMDWKLPKKDYSLLPSQYFLHSAY
jgi:hypothetical protein